MNCTEARKNWMLYLDNEGDPQLHLHIGDHLGRCPACAQWFARQQQLEDAVRDRLAAGDSTPVLWGRVLDKAGLAPRRRSAPALPEEPPVTQNPSPADVDTGSHVEHVLRFGRMLGRGWHLLALSASLCLAAAAVYIWRTPFEYGATAELLVAQQGGRPLNVANPDPSRPVEGGEDYIPTHVAILRSHVVVKRALDKVGLENLPTLRAARDSGRDPAQQAASALEIKQPNRLAKVIQIDFRAGSPDEAVRMVSALTASYSEFLDETYPRRREVIALINRARQDVSVDLDKAEQDYGGFLQKHPLLMTDEKGRSLLSYRLERWVQADVEARMREAQVKAQLDVSRRLAQDGTGLGVIVHAMGQLGSHTDNSLLLSAANLTQPASQDYVRQLRQEQQQLVERYGPHYTKVQELTDQIVRIQEQTRASQSRYERVEANDLVKALEQCLRSSEAMRAEMNKDLEQDKKAGADSLEEARLRTAVERSRALFAAVVDQLKQAELAGDFGTVNVQVLRPATALPQPVRPRRVPILAGALLAGVLAGTAAVAVRDRLRCRALPLLIMMLLLLSLLAVMSGGAALVWVNSLRQPAPAAPSTVPVVKVRTIRGNPEGAAHVVPSARFKIDPNAPPKDLLPAAPEVRKSAGPVLVGDLAWVPEVEFQAAPAKAVPVLDATRDTADLIAQINHLNGKEADGFLEALRGERPDLAGLPFAMGGECRTEGERRRQFTFAVANVRRALRTLPRRPATLGPGADRGAAENFWGEYRAACVREDERLLLADQAPSEDVTRARIAALMQVLAPESPDLRRGLAKYLSGVAHPEATRALARLAIFSPEDEVRWAAVDALQVRRERDYTDVLLRGLRYPWPAVARRAAEAAVKLERADLAPELVALLDEPDPRAPVLQEVGKKTVPVVHELVRVNHHRSCLMCHAPRDTANLSPEVPTAAVPVPGAPLPSPSEGYRPSSSDLVVRVDVTYLRQDFSVYQPVADANPWPEMQRFDFLVRTRVLTDEEAEAYRAQLDRREPGSPSPYRRAVVAALRDLTGRDT
jgi:uncharacterized protein involved in exopolysaccharide biosynthesis